MHQLGFITANAYTQPYLKDSEYSAVDMLYLALIPSKMHEAVHAFTHELKENKNAEKMLMVGWDQVKVAAIVKCCAVSMALEVVVPIT